MITAVLNLGTVISAINRTEAFRFQLKPYYREDLNETITPAIARYDMLQQAKLELINALSKNVRQQRELESLTEELLRLKTR